MNAASKLVLAVLILLGSGVVVGALYAAAYVAAFVGVPWWVQALILVASAVVALVLVRGARHRRVGL
jgi:membrane protein implicated in regulation of membrane protease activity